MIHQAIGRASSASVKAITREGQKRRYGPALVPLPVSGPAARRPLSTVLKTIVVHLVEGTVMSTVLPATVPDPSHLAAAGFLAGTRELTASAYRRDLRCFWQWCADRDLAPLAAKRQHIELYLRDLEHRGYAPATIS
jgi:integrase family protein with SAM-like domain